MASRPYQMRNNRFALLMQALHQLLDLGILRLRCGPQ